MQLPVDGRAEAVRSCLMWVRTDVPGSEVVLVDRADGVRASGTQHAVDPVPYRLEYELRVDASGVTSSLQARCEGDGWWRSLRMARTSDGWDVLGDGDGETSLHAVDGGGARVPARAGCQDAAALGRAVDIDIGGSPLTNVLPLRRLGAEALSVPGGVEVATAWVLPPTLEVVLAIQRYEYLADGRMRYGDADTAVTVTLDDEEFVLDYRGLARRVR